MIKARANVQPRYLLQDALARGKEIDSGRGREENQPGLFTVSTCSDPGRGEARVCTQKTGCGPGSTNLKHMLK
ncbi:MAG: hypothetical protein JW832_16630 [Deltaproteobacteria bacterium]|nr:hypothetical protein [Deltaproteobacteria bacterium]